MSSTRGYGWIGAAAICLVILSSQASAAQKSAECELSQEDYSVFTAVLQGLGGPEDPEEAWRGKDLIVVDLTGSQPLEKDQWNNWGFRSKSKAAPSAETRSDYEAKSKDSCKLKLGWGDAQMYKPLRSEEMSCYFNRKCTKGDGWQAFYKQYPNAAGFWTFSRPGYNAAHDEALLYVAHSCGWLCGTGHLYLLSRENGQWKVKNRLFLWIS